MVYMGTKYKKGKVRDLEAECRMPKNRTPITAGGEAKSQCMAKAME